MNHTNLDFTVAFLEAIKDEAVYHDAENLMEECAIALLWQGQSQAYFSVDNADVSKDIMLYFESENEHEEEDWLSILVNRDDPNYIVACYIWYRDNYKESNLTDIKGKIYERPGIIRRVLSERKKRARQLNFKVKLNKNLYDEHLLLSDDGRIYKVTIWDLKNQLGYVDNIDWKTNKLATSKHIMFLCDYIDEAPSRYKRLRKKKSLVELTLDPLKDYQLTWIYNQEITEESKSIIDSIFGEDKTHLSFEKMVGMYKSLTQLALDPSFIVRDEVFEKMSRYFDKEELEIKKLLIEEIDFSAINADLYPYQKEGALFALFRQSAIIADEMGLGKTIQAITTAILKKKYLGFKKTLIVCPASVKYQWAAEIEKFSSESVMVVSGKSEERRQMYSDEDTFFTIANYELIMRDYAFINEADYDLIILDEAQRIKNFNTKTAAVMQGLKKQHGLVLTGTPIENKLIDIYAIILFLDKYELTPLWEFSYQHCVFDQEMEEKINGYFNLSKLKDRLKDIVIRRQKIEVMPQLPKVSEKKYLIKLHPKQREIHASFGQSIASILAKKFKTKFDWDRIIMALTQMRRVSNSTYLIQNNTFHSSKMSELKYILLHQLDIRNSKRKIIIFSEWLDSLYLIERLLDELGVTYAKLTGQIPTEKRGKLISTFAENEDCKVFLSTEAGGSGLNLQMADTVINFELPWNPAKKNQRVGRINRIGQKSKNLLVIDLICIDSIEMRIASGLALKQNLFDGVLNVDNDIDEVDFTEAGRSQFMKELLEYVNEEEVTDQINNGSNGFADLFDDESDDAEPVFDPEDNEITFDTIEDELDWDSYLNEVLGEEDDLEDVVTESNDSFSTDQNEEAAIEPDDAMDSEFKDENEIDEPNQDESDDKESSDLKPEPEEDVVENGKPEAKPNEGTKSEGENKKPRTRTATETKQMEEVLNKGMDFLAGLYEMSTGKKMMEGEGDGDDSGAKRISIDEETGEVVLRFKLR